MRRAAQATKGESPMTAKVAPYFIETTYRDNERIVTPVRRFADLARMMKAPLSTNQIKREAYESKYYTRVTV